MATTHYTWDRLSDNVLMESDENGVTTATYMNEPGQYGKLRSQHRDGATSYYHYDGQGSTRQLTDESGNVTDTATYTAFGETVAKTGSTTNPFGFKGAIGYYANPETNDIYVRARTYQPALGRWMSVDPIGFRASDINLYRYSGNSPIAHSDPSGLLYGNFCGMFRNGQNGDPIDELDAACAAHDSCLATVGMFLNPRLQVACNALLCSAAMSADCVAWYAPGLAQ